MTLSLPQGNTLVMGFLVQQNASPHRVAACKESASGAAARIGFLLDTRRVPAERR